MNTDWETLTEALDKERGAPPSSAMKHIPVYAEQERQPNDRRRSILQQDARAIRVFRGHRDEIRDLAFSPEGQYAISGSEDCSFRVWDVSSGELLATIGPQGLYGAMNGVRISRDGFCVVGGHAGTLRVFDLNRSGSDRAEDLKLSHIRGKHRSDICEVAFSPDGRFVASGSSDMTIRVWELLTGGRMGLFRGHTGQVNGISYTPDGQRLISASHDRTLRLWDVATGACIRIIRGHQGPVWAVKVSPDGGLVVSGGDGWKLWDLESGRCVRQGPDDIGIVDLDISPDGRYLLTANRDRSVSLWDLQSGAVVHTFRTNDRVLCVAFSPDGRTALSDGEENAFILWNLEGIEGYHGESALSTLSQVAEFKRLLAYGQYDRAAQLSATIQEGLLPEPTVAAIHRLSRQARIYADAAGEIKELLERNRIADAVSRFRQVRPHLGYRQESQLQHQIDKARVAIRFSAEQVGRQKLCMSSFGRWMASIDDDGVIHVWDMNVRRVVHAFEGPEDSPGVEYGEGGMTVSPDGRRVLVHLPGKYLHMYESATGKCLWRKDGWSMRFPALRTHLAHTQLQFSRDGRFFLTCGQDTIKLWDADSGEVLRTFHGHTWYTDAADISKDGAFVVSGGSDRTVRLWDARTGRCLWTRPTESAPARVRFSDDDRSVISSVTDSLRVWRVSDARLLHEVDTHNLGCLTSIGNGHVYPLAGPYVLVSIGTGLAVYDITTGRCPWMSTTIAKLPDTIGFPSGVLTPDRRSVIVAGCSVRTIDMAGVTEGGSPGKAPTKK